MVLQNYEEGVYEATSKSNDFIHHPLKYYQDLKSDISYVFFLVILIVLLYRLPSNTSRNKSCSGTPIP